MLLSEKMAISTSVISVVTVLGLATIIGYLLQSKLDKTKSGQLKSTVHVVQGLGFAFLFSVIFYGLGETFNHYHAVIMNMLLLVLTAQVSKISWEAMQLTASSRPECKVMAVFSVVVGIAAFVTSVAIHGGSFATVYVAVFAYALGLAGYARVRNWRHHNEGDRIVTFGVVYLFSALLFMPKFTEFMGGDAYGLMMSAYVVTFPLMLSFLIGSTISVSQKALALLSDASNRDELTGLHNRRYFMNNAPRYIDLASREHSSTAILIMDIDRFKMINDTLGHGVGDQVLVRVANTIEMLSRETDMAIRYGGEEFVMLLPFENATGAKIVAERTRRHIENMDMSDLGLNDPVTVSIGIKIISEETDLEEGMDHADKALYQAKDNGRNQVQLVTNSENDDEFCTDRIA